MIRLFNQTISIYWGHLREINVNGDQNTLCYPAIEALAFAVLEMRKRERDFPEFDQEADMALVNSYSWQTNA